jgi:hypothetical protein
MRKSKEWIAILNGKRIDHNGFFCSAPCVTAYTKKEAKRLLSKAKKYYFNSYKLTVEVNRNTFLRHN